MSLKTSDLKDLLTYLETNKGKSQEDLKSGTSPYFQQTEIKKNESKEDFKDLQQNIKTTYKETSCFDVELFEKIIRKKLLQEKNKPQEYERPYISVTELFSCLRKIYYARMNYQINEQKVFIYPYSYLMRETGSFIHKMIQEIYPFDEVEKTIISEKYKVKGKVDGIIKNNVIEIKTIDPDKFENKYRENDLIQGLIYSEILNKEYGYNITNVTLIYILRTLKKPVIFDLPCNEEISLKYLKYGPILKKHLDEKTVPEKIGKTKEQCTYCEYKDFCIKDGGDDIQSPPKEKRNKKDSIFLF